MSKVKVIKVMHDGKHIATIDAYEASIEVFIEFGVPERRASRDGLWYSDMVDTHKWTKAQILSVCREEIESDLFPDRTDITYGPARIYNAERWFGL